MDRSLDEIIAERPRYSNRGRTRQSAGRRGKFLPVTKLEFTRNGGLPPLLPLASSRRIVMGQPFEPQGIPSYDYDYRLTLSFFFCLNNSSSEMIAQIDWVHDKFEDDRDTRPASFRGPRARRDGRLSPPPEQSSSGAKLRVNNLHYDITEEDLRGLFTGIGPILSLSLVYDRAGRSEGVAFVTYKRLVDAQTAIREFDGANAKGQPIRVTLLQTGERSSRRSLFDVAEKPSGSLFDRAERPRRDSRSLSPGSGNEAAPGRGRYRRSDVSKPPPENIDRYVPGQRNGRGWRGGENRSRNDSRRGVNGSRRPKKTQEQLDQEMEDYWGNNAGTGGDAGNSVVQESKVVAEAGAPAGDDDIDMIQ
ncbi:RNA binding protein [Coccidioides posadasii str. Silveira]|uniref:RNA binding protein n=1 Tax=Coccidioides posadasii (strain RMSCC 757 / Silveira) TaxID=443226 RepID=E9DI26_COCPS|nr:RNA binding protein [Coccidioides posadasii str. Silveira]